MIDTTTTLPDVGEIVWQELFSKKDCMMKKKTDKIKIVFSCLTYPFAIASYFRRALERRNDVELFTTGAFTGQFIPWGNGMTIPMKYYNQVDLPLPPNILHPNWSQIEPHLPWIPDLSITVDAGFSFADKPNVKHAHIATDPHVLNYDFPRTYADWFFNMQKIYSRPETDIYLPYAFDTVSHYPLTSPKEYDACLIGLHYDNRNKWVEALKTKGISVNYRIGDIYDEYREENAKASIGLNWSSMQDVTARVFEIMAMRMIPVINRVPDLEILGFEENRHYLGFDTLDEAVEKVIWAKNNPDQARQISWLAYNNVWENQHTYDKRIETVLGIAGFI